MGEPDNVYWKKKKKHWFGPKPAGRSLKYRIHLKSLKNLRCRIPGPGHGWTL